MRARAPHRSPTLYQAPYKFSPPAWLSSCEPEREDSAAQHARRGGGHRKQTRNSRGGGEREALEIGDRHSALSTWRRRRRRRRGHSSGRRAANAAPRTPQPYPSDAAAIGSRSSREPRESNHSRIRRRPPCAATREVSLKKMHPS